MKQRIIYIDLCKVFAIFLVTFAHCSQQISGEKFPDLLLSKDSFIAINMAIFMICSGFFMNVEKIKATSTKDYLLAKAQRLLLPMVGWYIVMCAVLFTTPRFTICWSIYWYLGSMFICLTLIKLLLNVLSNVPVVCFLSILVLTLMPMISFERSCYMIPFLWIGYGLRFFIEKVNKFAVAGLLFSYGVMYYFWDISYSVYVTPFHIWDADMEKFFAMLFRFIIGVVGGIGFIGLLRFLIDTKGFGWMKVIALKLGRYTLAFYTMSFVLNAILVKALCRVNWFVTTPGWLDFISLVVTTLMILLMYFVQKQLEKNDFTRLIFLGEK